MIKIKSASIDRKKRLIEIKLSDSKVFTLPVAKIRGVGNELPLEVYVDPELANRAITCIFASGKEECIHMDAFYEYNRDPNHMKEMLLYKMTLEAQKLVRSSAISKNEVLRRMETSASQLARLLDTANKTKSLDNMLKLLTVLGCEVDLKIKKAI